MSAKRVVAVVALVLATCIVGGSRTSEPKPKSPTEGLPQYRAALADARAALDEKYGPLIWTERAPETLVWGQDRCHYSSALLEAPVPLGRETGGPGAVSTVLNQQLTARDFVQERTLAPDEGGAYTYSSKDDGMGVFTLRVASTSTIQITAVVATAQCGAATLASVE